MNLNSNLEKKRSLSTIFRRICFLGLVLLFSQHLFAQEFVHPGLLHSQESLKRMHSLIKGRCQPAYGSYQIMRSLPEGKADYRIKGPFETISRAGKYGYTKDPCERDFNSAYYNAVLWIVTGDQSHANKSMEIIRAYANTLQKIEGPDEPLCAGLQGFILVNAAEIIRYTYPEEEYANGWNVSDTKKTESMFRKVFQPVLTEFYQKKPYTNGNWGIAVTKAQLAFGVFLNDRTLYDGAIDFFYHGKDNGTLTNYIAESGQSQEAGRDQAHVMLGIGCLAEIAEVAWTQGIDLYGASDNRIMKGYEYLSKSNLGYEVPFFTWKDLTGKYSRWTTLGEDGMGKFRSVFEIGYNHYIYRKGLEMPFTRMVLDRIRPEGAGFTCDNPGFGSLLFYLGEELNTNKEIGRLDEDLRFLNGWILSTTSLKPIDGIMSLMSSGIKMERKKVRYNAGKYPFIAIKIPRLPNSGNKSWFRISYSVMSAPEYWTPDPDKSLRIGRDIYVFKVSDILSNNGNRFSNKEETVSLFFDFGETCGEPVVLEWLRSFEKIEDIKY